MVAQTSACHVSGVTGMNHYSFRPLMSCALLPQFSFYGNLSPRRSLYRTLSDESVCSTRRGSSFASSRSSILDQALPNDILFSSTPPYHSTLPPRTHPAPSMGSLRSKWRPRHPATWVGTWEPVGLCAQLGHPCCSHGIGYWLLGTVSFVF